MTHGERLEWLVDAVMERSGSIVIAEHHTQDVEPLVVCLAWLRLALSYTKVLTLIVREELADASYPTARAVLEIYAEMKFLLHHGDRVTNARRVNIMGTLELREGLRKARAIADAPLSKEAPAPHPSDDSSSAVESTLAVIDQEVVHRS